MIPNQRDLDLLEQISKLRGDLDALTAAAANRWGRLPILTADPTAPPDGATWIRSDTGELILRIGGSSVAVPPTAGFRNAVINGASDISQRGNGPLNITAGVAVLIDGLVSGGNGSQNAISRQQWSLGAATPTFPYEPTYYARNTVTSVAGASNYAIHERRIEGVRTFAGGPVTYSFWAKADAPKNVAVEFHQYFGSGGSPSAEAQGIGVTTVSLTTTMRRYIVTTTLPSIAGKTLGTNGDDKLAVTIWLDAGSSWNARTNSLGQQSGTFDIWGEQLEYGTVATPFERRPVAVELPMCRRYYRQWGGQSLFETYPSFGFTDSATTFVMFINLDVPMRATPALAGWGTNRIVLANNTGFSVSTLSINSAIGSTSVIGMNGTTPGHTAGLWAYMTTNNSLAGYFTLSAEL